MPLRAGPILVRSLLAVPLLVLALATPAAAAPTVTQFGLPHPNVEPDSIITGPDGNLWFTEFGPAGNAIGRMTPSGALIGELGIPTNDAEPEGITVGPDHHIWFAEFGGDQIGTVTASGFVKEFDPTTPGSAPVNIITGPDGRLWFAENDASKIGRMTTAGTPAGEFDPTTANSKPFGLTVGADGNIWFTENNTAANVSKIGVMSPAGTMLHEYPTPTPNAGPEGIILGPDGNLWVAEHQAIARVTTAGVITEFPLSDPDSFVSYLTVGPDHNIWFADNGTGKLGTLDPRAPAIREFSSGITPASGPYGITTGPDCALWFTEINDSFNPNVLVRQDGNRTARADLGLCPAAASPQPRLRPPGAVGGRAKFRFTGSRVLIDLRTGRGTVKVSCRNVLADVCRFSLALSANVHARASSAAARRLTLGSARGTVPGGRSGKLKVKLGRRGRRLLARRRSLSVRASGSSRNLAGAGVHVSKRLTLRAKSRR